MIGVKGTLRWLWLRVFVIFV